MVKKFLLFGSAVLVMASCQTLTKTQTARTETITANIASVTVADLDVYPERVSETIEVTPDLRRGGEQSIKHAVEAKALEKNGRGDLLVEPQYVVKKKWTWLGPKIFEISVSGRPASFKNFRALDDSVWTNPVFRGVKEIHHYHNGTSGQGSVAPSASPAPMEEKESKPKYNWRPKGFRSFVDVTTPINVSLSSAESESGFNVLYTAGYQVNHNLFVGAGVGYSQMFEHVEYSSYYDRFEKNYNLKRIPFFIRGRAYFCRTRVAPFLDARFGYEVACNNPLKDLFEDNIHDAGRSTSHFNRMLFAPSLGLSVATKKGRNIDFSFTYNLTPRHSKYYDHYLAPSMTIAL